MQQITEEFIKSLTKRDILALDCAIHTGWYTAGHGYGTAYFPNTDKAPKKFGDNYQHHQSGQTSLGKLSFIPGELPPHQA